ncbi:MAG: hypothetical protein PHU23_15740 [Dehalococcoidales bacterium]|nr:hypothetical protein [Dehalococcoidales bacterium]
MLGSAPQIRPYYIKRPYKGAGSFLKGKSQMSALLFPSAWTPSALSISPLGFCISNNFIYIIQIIMMYSPKNDPEETTDLKA